MPSHRPPSHIQKKKVSLKEMVICIFHGERVHCAFCCICIMQAAHLYLEADTRECAVLYARRFFFFVLVLVTMMKMDLAAKKKDHLNSFGQHSRKKTFVEINPEGVS